MSAAVRFYRTKEAFPHTRMEDRDADMVVSVQPHDVEDQGGNYEFTIKHVGTKRRDREPIALRVDLFSDSWRAFADLPEFFALLVTLDRSRESERSTLTLEGLSLMLVELGWVDATDTYASQHSHSIGCLVCGERVTR